MQAADRQAGHQNFISPYTARGRPYPHTDRSWQEQIAVIQPYKGYSFRPVQCRCIRLALTGTLAEAFMCRVAVVQSWRLAAFDLSGSRSGSKNWRNGSGWRLRESWWTNAWLGKRAEWSSTSNAPAPSVTAIWEWFSNGRSTCRCRRSIDGA